VGYLPSQAAAMELCAPPDCSTTNTVQWTRLVRRFHKAFYRSAELVLCSHFRHGLRTETPAIFTFARTDVTLKIYFNNQD